MPLSAADFFKFFTALHGAPPFPWQARLAAQAYENGWPEVIDLPTASGKTACLDIAVFLSAISPEAPRRIFFVVDRRIVVNAAFIRMKRVADKLRAADGGILLAVADALRRKAGSRLAPPLTTHEMRGGIYRDESWFKNPLQPLIVTSTVDQVGSRLLFRGYGVSPSTQPIHAGLIANDSLIFLDEAHCSAPFAQTLKSIENYRSKWAVEPLKSKFQFVEMTATPAQPSDKIFRLDDVDRANDVLKKRLTAQKPVELVVSANKPKDLEHLARTLANRALALIDAQPEAKRVAIIVNRVLTARLVHRILSSAKGEENVDLLIGRMRPVDRDEMVEKLKPLESGQERCSSDEQHFVVATQTIEVGADLDFDILVSECAALDALLQRFGRLNRIGAYPLCRGSVVVGAGLLEAKQTDPVYGTAIASTWRWLNTQVSESGSVDFGMESSGSGSQTVAQRRSELSLPERNLLQTEPKWAPVLLPSHLDALCQTNPQPCYEPSVSLFLHGPDSGEPDVQVVWRADLNSAEPTLWEKIVDLCPPVSAEALTVPISSFRKWFSGQQDPVSSDLERSLELDNSAVKPPGNSRRALAYRKGQSNNPPFQ